MNHLTQILLVASSGVVFMVVILFIARKGVLSMRYTLGWLFVGGCVVIGGLFSGLVEPIARALHVSASSVVLATAATGLLALTIQLSITVSGLTEWVRTLAEASALQHEELTRLGQHLEALGRENGGSDGLGTPQDRTVLRAAEIGLVADRPHR